MTQKIISLMVETLEEKFEGDVNAFQPADEEKEFMISVGETVVAVDTAGKNFSPLKRGEASDYLKLKKIMEKVGLEYITRTEKK